MSSIVTASCIRTHVLIDPVAFVKQSSPPCTYVSPEWCVTNASLSGRNILVDDGGSLGLMLSVIVLVPHRISIKHLNDLNEIKNEVQKTAKKKLKYLRVAQWSLVSGLFVLLLLSAVYFLSVYR